MRRAGDFSFTLTRVYPYTSGNIFIQPFDWMETGFRYTSISNRLYGPVSFSGSQAYKDKSIDVKFRVNRESAWLPDISLGFRDIAGTGLFSGEYLVGSKRTGPLDWSLGLGWGYVGNRGDLGNPIGHLFPSFDVRKDSAATGSFALNTYFHGPTALFGGLQYQSPWDPLILKLEYDGNNYQHEPLGNVLPQSSPWNFGLVYRWGKNVDVSTGIERGNTAMLSITLHSDLDKLFMPKLADPRPVPVRDVWPNAEPDWKNTVRDIKTQANWKVSSIQQNGHDLSLTVDDANPVYWKDRLDKAVSVLHRDAPSNIDQFNFVYQENGVKMAENDVDRNAWVRQKTQYLAPSEQRNPVVSKEPESETRGVELFKSDPPLFEPYFGMDFNYYLGGPNGFVFYQFAPYAKASLNFSKNTWLQGDIQYDILDNYNHWIYDGPSLLPRVRTYVREYRTTSRLTMPNLQLTHVGRLTENQYWSVYGGYLEWMFAGVGGEWLYRPFDSRTAFGVDINEVQQRDFAQNFNLRNYRVLTGHGTLYWDTGWKNVLGTVSFGRYLAGDIGATFDFSRVFDNGVRVGAFFTKTNVSAQQFGEGSFDKGIYIQIPLDTMLMKSSDTTVSFVWHPLTRDGGAILDRQVLLYDVTNPRNPRSLEYASAPPPDQFLSPENRRGAWQPRLDQRAPSIQPKPDSSQWHESEPEYRQSLAEELYGAGYKNIRVSLDGSNRLSVFISSENLRPDSLAVGRAARIVLAHAPLDIREIRISFAERVNTDVVYDFLDTDKLKAYFDGSIGAKELMPYVRVQYLNPTAVQKDPLYEFVDMKPVDKSFSQAFTPDMRVVPRVERDVVNAARIASGTDWMKTGAIGAGLVLGSALFDKSANNFALNHASNSILRNFDAFGNALPWVESAAAAMSALGSTDPELSRTGYAASEAAVTSYALVLGLKYAVGRARPWTGQNNHSFYPFAGSASKGTDGFPSGHAIVAWSVLTPYAMEYHMPWLYGLGVITDLSRVGSRNHWVSDTVAGSFLGYGIGKFFWEASEGGPHVFLTPYGV
ncbi:MAG TPA: YjbH domain-containing protein, partial [Burkholderiales bacterium]|nr:YjbH domain-containing protein [Burkholderiales bacterium]